MTDHTFLVLLAKSFGLLCLIVGAVLVLVYALRPSAKRGFERAGSSIIDGDDRPVLDHPPARDESTGRHG